MLPRALPRPAASPLLEVLEARLFLTGDIIINEFMADNTRTLQDKDGAYSDWIEIYNGGTSAADLAGWYLTDSPDNLTKWRFPSTTLAAGGYLVVFASDKNLAVSGQELHTNFKLGADGDYLALVQPDGDTIATEYKPHYPSQFADVSYGLAQDILTKTLAGPDADTHVRIPTGPIANWTRWDFDDSGWTVRGTSAVGYESTVPGLAVASYFSTGSIPSLTEAESVIATPGKQASVVRRTDPVVNYWGGGYFGSDLAYPGTTFAQDPECLVTLAVATLTIPVSDTYTFCVSSDDGFGLDISSATDSFHMEFAGLRGTSPTFGSHSFAAGEYTLRLVAFENWGGQSAELIAARGQFTDYNNNFHLVGDTASGGLRVDSLPIEGGGGAGVYGPLIHTNVETAMKGVNASAYIRIPFTVTSLAQYNSLTLKMKYDDGFVAYLNGTEVACRKAPASVAWDSAATAEHSKADAMTYEEIDVSAFLNLLRTGQNVLAIQGLNFSAGDGDFLILPELVDIDYLGLGQHYFAAPTPGAANLSQYFAFVEDTKFDHGRGFYNAAFDLAITTVTPGAAIRYTLDGSPPTATTGTLYAGPIHITKTTVVRAAAFKDGFEPTNVDTQSYIFPAEVIRQPAAPAGFPTDWNGTAADYEMDPTVVNDAAYSLLLADALKSLPTMSIVTEMDDMFGPGGVYTNPWSDITVPCSLEYFTTDGLGEFQIDAGVKMYGNVGRDPSFRKHTFRLRFQSQYGPAHLNYDLFGGNATTEFDTLILRSNFNDGWVWGDANVQYIREQWCHEAQLAMGDLSSHGTFVNLYVNGLYWGLYNPVERPDDAFGAAYLGGAKEEYDARNCNETGVIAGDEVAWRAMFNLADTGNPAGGNYNANALASDASYQAIQQYLDVPGLADYILLNYYGGNWDWDGHNWYAVRRRVTGAGYRFLSWDAEGTLGANWTGLGVDANATGINNDWNPTRLFQQLRANADFRTLLADRIYKHFFNDGIFTPARAAALYESVATEVELAIIGESARWGDIHREPPYTRDGDWTVTRNWEKNTYFPQRTAIVIQQLRNAGMYPNLADGVEPPDFSQNGGNIQPGFNLVMTNPNAGGTIYYTLDGSDPRLPGGGISAVALPYTGQVTLSDSRLVRARVKNGALWSAMHEAVFLVPTPPPLRITELMYHPAPPEPNSLYGPEDFEFIELKNVGAKSLAIGGMHFGNGVTCTFADKTLAAGGYALVVSNKAAFQSRYGHAYDSIIVGEYTGHLNNAGEHIVLDGKFGETILDFSYSSDWYSAADGEGFSIGIVNPLAASSTWIDPESWWPSQNAGGTPGADNVGMAPHTVVINELLAHTDADPRGDWVELKNTTAQPINVGGWYLSDSDADLKKYRIAAGTSIAAGGFLLLTQRDNFGNTGDAGYRSPIGFGEYGGKVYLTAADSGDNLLGYREVQEFDDSEREFAFTRYTKTTGRTDFVAESQPTPGTDNAYPLIGGVTVGGVTYSPGVILSEVMYHPGADADEFLELRNCTNVAVPLYDPDYPDNTWKVGGGVAYVFPVGASIPSGGYLLLVNTDPAVFRAKYGVPAGVQVLGPYTGMLNNAGENVKLYRPGEPDPLPPYKVPYYLVDRIEYKPLAPWPLQADGFGPSLQRLQPGAYGNDPVNWGPGPDEGTPGQPNGSADVTPPRLVSVKTTDGTPNSCLVTFSEALDATSSRVAANYAIDNGAVVLAAEGGADNRTVVLTTSALSEGIAYTLTINHVKNVTGVEVMPDAQATFNYVDSGSGLKGQYFQYTDPSNKFDPANLVVSRIDPAIDFQWGGSPPAPGVPAGTFAVRWTGGVKARYAETYTFYTVTDGGVSLWVNGQQLISDATDHGSAVENAKSITLQAGVTYDVRMDFFQASGGATAQLLWSSASQPKAVVPAKYLYDTSKPTVVSAKAVSTTVVDVVFTEEMDRDTAQVAANYVVTYPVSLRISVMSAILWPDHKTVRMTLGMTMSPGITYTVSVSKVKARSRPVEVQAASLATFMYSASAGGGVLREWWTDVAGNEISKLTLDPRYPDRPSGSDVLTSLESPVNWGDNYGERLRAYLTPPTTGAYRFWIAADQTAELWLSTNDSPVGAQRIAYVTSPTPSRGWTWQISQNSYYVVGDIGLMAGQRYYIEVLHKEGTGNDNVAVRWRLPGGAVEEPIPATRLTPFVRTPAATVSIAGTDRTASETGPDKGTFTITRTGSTAQNLTVYYAVTGTARTADIQQYLSGTAVILAGRTQVAVDVIPVDDTLSEGVETVILTLLPDAAYGIGTATTSISITDNDLGSVTAVMVNNQPGRSVSGIDPSAGGVRTIAVTFSQPMTFAKTDVLVQKVTISGKTVTIKGTITPTAVTGSGTNTMTISLPASSVIDTWIKVTLKGSATLKDVTGHRLDGEPKKGGTGLTYICDAARDLPTGNGTAGGNAIFYVGSLRCDFGSASNPQRADGKVTSDDVAGFVAKFQVGDLDADFRGPGSSSVSPDGRVTPADLDGFISMYHAAIVAKRSLAPLPGAPVLGALVAPPTAPAALPFSRTAIAAAMPPSRDETVSKSQAAMVGAAAGGPVAVLRSEVAAFTGLAARGPTVPLASGSKAAAPADYRDPALAPDGQTVDLLALPSLDLALKG